MNESECYEDLDEDSDIGQDDVETLNGSGLLCTEKSKQKYQRVYDKFKAWMGKSLIAELSEEVLLTYFSTELNEFKASSTNSTYSMLRTMINIHDKIDISSYYNLRVLLKGKSSGYNARQSVRLKKDEVMRFLKEAPDCQYLGIKVSIVQCYTQRGNLGLKFFYAL